MVPNSLGDLTKRENRFGHWGVFPFQVIGPTLASPAPSTSATLVPFSVSGVRTGDDVILTNVLAFDVQVWDPNAPILYDSTNNIAIEPRDPGVFSQFLPTLTLSSITTPSAYGAYVDLGYPLTYTPGGTIPQFYQSQSRSVLPGGSTYLSPVLPVAGMVSNNSPARSTTYTYDTWSLHYENNGIQENSAHNADTGMNGLDDLVSGSTNGVVDDYLEYDTQAPFAAPLRGLRITVRCYEPSSQQVRRVHRRAGLSKLRRQLD